MALSPECPRTPSLTNVISMAVKRWGRAVVEGGHGSLAAGWVCWMTLLGDLNTVPQRSASSESVQLLLVLHPSEDYVVLVEPCWKLTCFAPSLLHACQDPLLALWMSPVFPSCIVTHLEDVGDVSDKTSDLVMLALRNRSCKPALQRTKSCRRLDAPTANLCGF